MAAESYTSDTNLDVGVTLSFHHAPHEVVLGYQVLGLHQMDSQHSLNASEQQQAQLHQSVRALHLPHLEIMVYVYLGCKLWVRAGVLWSRWLRFS